MIKYSWKARILHMNQFYITQTIPWEIFVTSKKTVTSINRAQFFWDYTERNLHRKNWKGYNYFDNVSTAQRNLGVEINGFLLLPRAPKINFIYISFFFFFFKQTLDQKCMWNQVTAIIMYMVHFHYCLLTMRFKWMRKVSDPYFTSGNY